MVGARLLAGLCFLGLALAAGGTLRLARAESMWRMASPPTAGWPISVGNATYYEQLAEREPALATSALRQAVSVNPRDSAAWISLGLQAEREGDMDRAARCLLQAEKVDRQYLPAWTSANFFFRTGNANQFWRAAARAAEISYDDPAPLIELADHREPRAEVALQRLGDSPRLERGYLHFLIVGSRWTEAQGVAARLASREEARDTELLIALVDHLIAADQGDLALEAWNGLLRSPIFDSARSGGLRRLTELTKGDFESQPSGRGFDWRVTAPPGASAAWAPARLRFWLTGSAPDASVLLEQWVVLKPSRYRLRYAYQTEGLAQPTGLSWVLLHRVREEAASPALEHSPLPVLGSREKEWCFCVAKTGLFQLQLVYRRVPGTMHLDRHADFGSVSLETL